MNDVYVRTSDGFTYKLYMLDQDPHGGPGSITSRLETDEHVFFSINDVMLSFKKNDSISTTEMHKVTRRMGWFMIVEDLGRRNNENVRGTVPSFFGRHIEEPVTSRPAWLDSSGNYQASGETRTDTLADGTYYPW